MGKLSHIDDIEKRQAEERQAAHEQLEDVAPQRPAQEQTATQEPEQGASAFEASVPDPESMAAFQEANSAQAKSVSYARTADEEAQFHGLSSNESMGIGQKALIVAAVVIAIAAVIYVLNYWFHFI